MCRVMLGLERLGRTRAQTDAVGFSGDRLLREIERRLSSVAPKPLSLQCCDHCRRSNGKAVPPCALEESLFSDALWHVFSVLHPLFIEFQSSPLYESAATKGFGCVRVVCAAPFRSVKRPAWAETPRRSPRSPRSSNPPPRALGRRQGTRAAAAARSCSRTAPGPFAATSVYTKK
jgi:hypothetical protein